jgi:hypothetical protein
MVLVKAPKGKISHHVSSSLTKPKSITLNPFFSFSELVPGKAYPVFAPLDLSLSYCIQPTNKLLGLRKLYNNYLTEDKTKYIRSGV